MNGTTSLSGRFICRWSLLITIKASEGGGRVSGRALFFHITVVIPPPPYVVLLWHPSCANKTLFIQSNSFIQKSTRQILFVLLIFRGWVSQIQGKINIFWRITKHFIGQNNCGCLKTGRHRFLFRFYSVLIVVPSTWRIHSNDNSESLELLLINRPGVYTEGEWICGFRVV